MKKLFMTAIALIAFNGVSMGSNGIQKALDLDQTLEITTKELDKSTCEQTMIDTYNYIMDTYNEGGDDILLLNVLLGSCNQ
jgi:hypothetical protein